MTDFWMFFSVVKHYSSSEWQLPEEHLDPIIAFKTFDEVVMWVRLAFGAKANGEHLTVTTKKFNGGNPIDVTDHYIAHRIELGKSIYV